MTKNSLSYEKFSTFLCRLRQWEDSNLELAASRIYFDLFLYIAQSHYSNRSINSKTIHNSIQHSQRNLAYALKKFKERELIYIEINMTDHRIKNILPTKKFCKLFKSYAEFINSNLCLNLKRKASSKSDVSATL